MKFFHALSAKLRITDLKTEDKLIASLEKIKDIPIEKYTFGKHEREDVDWADLVLLNPDIPRDSEIMQYVAAANKEIQMEEALFVKLCPARDVVGITGTRGKTTTTFLTHEVLKTQYPVVLAGNVSGAETLMNLFDNFKEETKVVLELSSFQLFGFHLNKISPRGAVWTNIYEDHLNKYASMEEYINDKKAIYLYQNPDDYFIRNISLRSHELIQDSRGKNLFFQSEDVSRYKRRLSGKHNEENYAASLQVARIFEIREENIARVFSDFPGVPFRQEKIAEINGVSFINDTTATTPTSAIIALQALKDRPIILIAGGNSKNCVTDEYAKLVAQRCKKIIFLKGNATDNFRNSILTYAKDKSVMGEVFDDFEKAVRSAFSEAQPGDVILLSPGFTSFGMFESEFDRGRQFNVIVKKLAAENKS